MGADPNMLSSGPASVDTQTTCTPIISATINDNTAVLELLLQSGADVGGVDSDGFAALQHAVVNNRLHCASLLLRRGMQQDRNSDLRERALILAEENNNSEESEQMVKLLKTSIANTYNALNTSTQISATTTPPLSSSYVMLSAGAAAVTQYADSPVPPTHRLVSSPSVGNNSLKYGSLGRSRNGLTRSVSAIAGSSLSSSGVFDKIQSPLSSNIEEEEEHLIAQNPQLIHLTSNSAGINTSGLMRRTEVGVHRSSPSTPTTTLNNNNTQPPAPSITISSNTASTTTTTSATTLPPSPNSLHLLHTSGSSASPGFPASSLQKSGEGEAQEAPDVLGSSTKVCERVSLLKDRLYRDDTASKKILPGVNSAIKELEAFMSKEKLTSPNTPHDKDPMQLKLNKILSHVSGICKAHQLHPASDASVRHSDMLNRVKRLLDDIPV
eukprot:TRINITY_DN8038_c0_g1_i2.p1 TRINITY_DN8038_c0_g1~~TRINITY_DN8038_c0_g1_i2.p1  ORF type:complete len:440 (-),score=122.43 TRINITY_DN8038_c0_g1_i2:78-1397(-)